jgi:Na+-driven multidrug efflux pump
MFVWLTRILLFILVTDYSARTLSFLYTGTTNLVATSRQRQMREKQPSENGVDHAQADTRSLLLQRTFVGALRMALLVGSGLGITLFVLATPLTARLIGNAQLDPGVGRAAARYVRIRALGMPAAAIIGTSQAACLGLQDVNSPLKVIGVAALVNLVSDLMLVGRRNPWIGGAAGAAWATSFSQYFAMALFLRWLTSPPSPKVAPIDSAQPTSTNPQSDAPPKPGRLMMLSRIRSVLPRRERHESFSTRGLLAGHLNRQAIFQRPTNETTSGYMPYVVPVTTTQVGRCSTYIAMGHVVSSSFGTVSMAANQVITSIFYSLIPIADSLSLTMQSFLPGIVMQEPSPQRAKALRTTITNLYKCAGIFGLALASAVACIPLASRLFTTDPAVSALVASIVPILFVIFSLHGVFCGSEGLLLGQRDLKFLGRMYAVYFCVVPYLMLRIKSVAQRSALAAAAAGGPHPPTLRSVWTLFLAYQLFRISVWVGRVLWLQRRAEKHATANLQT